MAGSPHWSLDGKQIYFYETSEIGAMHASFGSTKMGPTHIVSVNVDSGIATQLTVGDGIRRWPQPLSDGSIGCLVTEAEGKISLAIIKNGKLTKGPEGEFRSPSWSTDGKTVVYAKLMPSPNVEVLPGFTRQPDFRLTQLAGGGFFPAPSPKDDQVVLSTFSSLISVLPNGSIKKTLIEGNGDLILSPAWSPDGKKIAFSRGIYFRPGNHPNAQIGLMNADGSNVQMSGTAGTNSGFPTWSPDGKSIVYSQDAHLVVWTLANDQRRNLTLPGGQRDNFPQWSPKGDWIAFVSDRDSDEDFKLFLVRPDGTGLHRLTNDSGDAHCTWSPDGEWLIFSSARMGFKDEAALSESPQPYGELFIIRPDGTGLRQLTDDKWESGTASWIH